MWFHRHTINTKLLREFQWAFPHEKKKPSEYKLQPTYRRDPSGFAGPYLQASRCVLRMFEFSEASRSVLSSSRPRIVSKLLVRALPDKTWSKRDAKIFHLPTKSSLGVMCIMLRTKAKLNIADIWTEDVPHFIRCGGQGQALFKAAPSTRLLIAKPVLL